MAAALEGIRVLELTAGMAGPWIGRIMAYCGAEVIKVESRDHPDVTRQYVSPQAPELGVQAQLSPWLTDWNAGKRFVGLDLRHPEGAAIAKRLVAQCDVVVENYARGALERLGLGFPELRRARPNLILLSSSGYGATGPCRHYVTWGPNLEALSGLATVSGFLHRPCTITQYAYSDVISALHGLFAVMCALDYRSRTGRGQRIDLSQFEVTVACMGPVLLEFLANGEEPQRLGNRSRHAAPHGCYPCAGEGRWIAIAVASDAEWTRLCRVAGKPEWHTDPRFATEAARLENAAALDEELSLWTRAGDAYELMRKLQCAGVAAGVVQTVEDQFLRDPQLAARGFFERVSHVRKGEVVATGIPLGLTGTPGRTGTAGLAIGADNEYVLGTLLGMSAAEISRLIEAGAVHAEGASREAPLGVDPE